ncbi:MAG: DUF4230 domain-containing protein [Lachnospiraceae bacterium]|nr:DUF4230 domain-containing protein [Lachnospiraceae bacterium]
MIRRRNPLFGWLVGIALLAAALGIGFFWGWKTYAKSLEGKIDEEAVTEGANMVIEEDEQKITISNIVEIVEPASELVATKYFYKDADVYENYKEAFGQKLPFTTDKAVFTYEGTVSVGIELAEVEYEIDEKNKIIVIVMPPVKVLSNEIDASSFEYPYVSDSIFNNTSMEDYTTLLARLQEEKRVETANNTELIQAATANAKGVLKNFLTSSHMTKDYQVQFK